MNASPRPTSPPRAGQQGVDTPAFRRLWWSWTISLCGDGVRNLALPLYVAFTTKDPLAAGLVAAAEMLPWLMFALPAGALVDRLRPRSVLLAAHASRAILTAGLVAALSFDVATVPVLCVFAFALVTAETFAYPASQIMLVELAGENELEKANSRFFAVTTVGVNLVGPVAAGTLFSVGPVLAFAADGFTFVIAAALVATLPEVGQPTRNGKHLSLRRDILDGLRQLIQTPGLTPLVVVVAFGTIGAATVNSLMALYAVTVLNFGPIATSTLLVALAVSTLASTFLAPRLSKRIGDSPLMITGMLLNGAGMITFGLAGNAIGAWAGIALIGLGLGLWNVLSAARRQRLTPAGSMGRISGAYRVVAWGLMPVGAVGAGTLATATTLSTPFIAAGVLVSVIVLVMAKALTRTSTLYNA